MLIKNVAVIGMDIAKQVFQVHGQDAQGNALFNKKLRREDVRVFFENLPPCIVAMEACGTSYHWAREIALLGHTVRLLPTQLVKAFVPRGKTDANDAIAIAETLKRKDIRFVPIKSRQQQAFAVLQSTRALLIRQRTKSVNALRSHLSEFGLIAGLGQKNVEKLIAEIQADKNEIIPSVAMSALDEISEEISLLDARIERLDRKLAAEAKADADIARLMTIPGVGILTASAIKAAVSDPGSFKSSRHFAAWLGLTPKANSSGGSSRSKGISKMGNSQLRVLLFMAATAAIRAARVKSTLTSWLKNLLARRPAKVAIVALSNKIARVVWALLKNGGVYHARLIEQQNT